MAKRDYYEVLGSEATIVDELVEAIFDMAESSSGIVRKIDDDTVEWGQNDRLVKLLKPRETHLYLLQLIKQDEAIASADLIFFDGLGIIATHQVSVPLEELSEEVDHVSQAIEADSPGGVPSQDDEETLFRTLFFPYESEKG